ncbi:AMP-binding protein [Deinococcus sp.]|uniref:AMP-binding protein n=1 Tax=Deinococcus sp. TaxID=47478 RepID=UPI003C7D808D
MSGPAFTVPGLLASLARQHGDEVALRHKQYGLWNEVSCRDYLSHVQATAVGLRNLGMQAGERVAIICENTPLWLYAQLGVQAAGGVSVGLYPSMGTAEMGEVLALTGANWAIVQGEEQVDRLLELQASQPLRRVIYGSERGMHKHTSNPALLSFGALRKLGQEQGEGAFTALLAAGTPDDLAHLILTAGTTGAVRAVKVTHHQALSLGRALLETDPLRPGDDHLSFLPLAWSGEQLMSVSVALQSRLTVNFPESSETVMTDLAELGPQVMYTPPRLWEDLRADLLGRLNGSYGLNRVISMRLLRASQQASGARLDGRRAGGASPLWQGTARAMLLRPLLDRVGLSRLRRAYVTGAALSPELTRFFHALGVNLKAAYGQAESLGLTHMQRDGEVRPGTVGQPLPGAESRLEADGSLRVRAPWLSGGYYGDDAATALRWQGGWLHTGDAGEMGMHEHLSVRGRISDLCTTLAGQVVEPQRSERRLKLSPYLRDALVLAEGQDAATALLALDEAAVGRWAETQRLASGTFADLSQRGEVAVLIRSEVEAANLDLPAAQQVRRFAVLYKSLDADDGELTRTGTLRRDVVAARFAPLIEGLRDGASETRTGAGSQPELTIQIHHLAAPPSDPVLTALPMTNPHNPTRSLP